MKTDELVSTLIESGVTSNKEWEALNQEMESKVEHYTSEVDPTTKDGQMKIKVINNIKEAKRQEVWVHIANQVLKAVKEGDWRPLGEKYTSTPVRRHIAQNRNRLINPLTARSFENSWQVMLFTKSTKLCRRSKMSCRKTLRKLIRIMKGANNGQRNEN